MWNISQQSTHRGVVVFPPMWECSVVDWIVPVICGWRHLSRGSLEPNRLFMVLFHDCCTWQLEWSHTAVEHPV